MPAYLTYLLQFVLITVGGNSFVFLNPLNVGRCVKTAKSFGFCVPVTRFESVKVDPT
jgi:hypothetical protein